ncbi:hypothetical protein GCM10023339_00340 [Alloalcanivorax gelatiniphagus]
MSRSWRDSATSMAVTTPPFFAMLVATAPTTLWSGAVYNRMVIEYDDAVAAMPQTLHLRTGYGQVTSARARVVDTEFTDAPVHRRRVPHV